MRQNPSRRGTFAALCALTAIAAVGLTACQDKDDNASSTDGPPSATATAKRTPEPLTGDQLTKELAPASLFAPGLAVDPSATRDTGSSYQTQAVENPPKAPCSTLDTTGWMTITGISGVSFTQQDRFDKSTTTEVYQGIDVFKGTTSTTVLDKLSRIADRCPSFTDDQTHTKVKVTVKPLPGIGDGAYKVTLSCPGWQSGNTLIAARVGTAVVSVLSTDGSAGDGSGTAKKVAAHIAAGLKGKA
ncbi:hypothetical protein [Streptomyces sp. NBC_01190]|uniref:hypothetical protein n=1 Tax=Streptomyces sp. NBC_01190 TaxID=2903767 RepID=UPI00386E2C76|nr:hypothetical protein OG519_12120 [Streptomyces sp. NBC_01190]